MIPWWMTCRVDRWLSFLRVVDEKSYLMPHQAAKGMIPQWTTCRVDRWLNLLPDAPPGSEGHDTVVDNVEGGQVAELLAQQKEDGVQVE